MPPNNSPTRRQDKISSKNHDEVPNLESTSHSEDDSTEGATKETPSDPGMKAEAVDFYMNQMLEWTEEYPHWISEAVENDRTAQYAILKRNRQSSDTRKKFSLQTVVVQSPLIKQVLGTVFKGYPGITTELERLEFDEPFEPFVHRWEKFQEARNAEKDPETKAHLNILWGALEQELRLTLETKTDLIENGVMTFKYLWTIFEPNTLVVKQSGSSHHVASVISNFYTESGFYCTNETVDWDGTSFGTKSVNWIIGSYAGTRSILELPFLPLFHHPDAVDIQNSCISRGKNWEAHCKYMFKAYKGLATDISGSRRNIDCRVIIDTTAFNTFNPNYFISLQALIDDSNYIAPNPPSDNAIPSSGVLNNYQLLLSSDELRGYSLKDKVWLYLKLNQVIDITWNESAFESLILPNDTKDLVLAFARTQIGREQTFDDVIEGKGKGIIILLSGPPGVGKTLTAEAVAETMKVPLYMMSAGDLGTAPYEVEASLKTILDMTTQWKAVLLLDEADVFLEARSTHDLERNKLVSIFLRMLEYYEGFLFLTSNRIDNIDAAFESRIHLLLQYQDLSPESRKLVWTSFLQCMVKCEGFSEQQIELLASKKLNGRQIKNILKTSQLLAGSKSEPLGFKHVEIVTKLRADNEWASLKGN